MRSKRKRNLLRLKPDTSRSIPRIGPRTPGSPFINAPPLTASGGGSATTADLTTITRTTRHAPTTRKNREGTKDKVVEAKRKCKKSGDVRIELADTQKIPPKGRVVGSLFKHFEFWESFCQNPWVLGIIKHGYVIPLKTIPDGYDFPNNLSARRHPDFVTEEIKELLQFNFIFECSKKPRWVNPLTVAENSDKLRLVLDLSFMNEYLELPTFKQENIKTALPMVSKNGYAAKFDITSAFHHVSMHPSQYEYLSFCWNGKCYSYRVMPFGLASAPYTLYKVIRPLLAKWRGLGIKIVIYVDDAIILGETKAEVLWAVQIIKQDLDACGFVWQPSKCHWDPTQVIKWIGFVLDLKCFRLLIPKEKIEQTLDCIKKLERKKRVTPRQIAGFTGKINAFSEVVGAMSQLHTRFSTDDIVNVVDPHNYDTYDNKCDLSQEARDELEFWNKNLWSLRARSLAAHKSRQLVMVFSDASDTGMGAYVSIDGIEHVSHVKWTPKETKNSSAWRELKAVEVALTSFGHKLRGRGIQWNTDNKAITAIIPKGSTKMPLQTLAIRIFRLCTFFQIKLSVQWIPRSENQKADAISRYVDDSDWFVQRHIFTELQQMLQIQFSIDCFADHRNKQCERFYSRYWVPGTLAINCLTRDWSQEIYCWLVPPVHMVSKTIDHVLECQCNAVLLTPWWTSATFWPRIFGPNGLRIPGVKTFLRLSGKNVFSPGQFQKTIFNPDFKSDVLVVVFEKQLF